tara:strand:+ start:252 stop:575 length:324 start_codon:yes stop_codon:yes gene_type:complete
MKTYVPENTDKTPEEKIGIAKIKIMFEDSFRIFNAKSGYMTDVHKQREKDNATAWFRSKDCEFFCDLAGTEQDHIIKLHDTLTYKYNTGKITLDEVRFAIRKLELKI